MTQTEALPDKSSLPEINVSELTALYREMLLIRRVEELAAKAYTQRKILGFCHLYIGQESVAVGAAASTKNDYWMAASMVMRWPKASARRP
jgi:pyruvate dehydrogenase E1 component alpha subunit